MSLNIEEYREHLVREEGAARRRLIDAAEQVEHDAQGLIRRLREGPCSVNCLGELQQRATSVEVAVGRYHEAREALRDFRRRTR